MHKQRQFHGMIGLLAGLLLAMIPALGNASVTLPVNAGWGLFSSPIGFEVAAVFDDSQTFISLWKWKDNKWAVYLPGGDPSYAIGKGFNQLSTIAPGEGFWLNSKNAATVNIVGNEVADENLTLNPGWNLKGLTVPKAIGVNTCFADALKIESVWKWVACNWAVYLPGQSDGGVQYANGKGFSALQTLDVGEGFWVNSKMTSPGSVLTSPPNQASFSPVLYYGSSATAMNLSWEYQINGGLPLSTSIEGMAVNFYFNNLLLGIDPNSLTRVGSFSGSITGAASGSFTASTSEQLASWAEMSLVESSNLAMNMSLAAGGESADIALNLMVDYNPATDWFLDRSDLDQLPIGFVYDEQGTVYGTASGSVAIGGYGASFPTLTISSPEKWTIIGKETSVVVKGKTYNNIVKVTRTTVMPGVDLSGNNQTMTVTYWVAKGIGMVKGVGYLQFFGKPLTIELIDTNLTQ